MKILVVPTTDWLGHPFPSRLHHIFERIADHNEVHVLRFAFYPEKKLNTRALVHEIDDVNTNQLAFNYILNAPNHYSAIRKIIKKYNVDIVVISNLLTGYIATKAASGIANLVYDLSDYFPASGCGYYFDVHSLLGKVAMFTLEKILSRTLRLVDLTITCSCTLMDYVGKLGIENVLLVPNGVDEFFWAQKHDGKAIREKYELDEYVTVGYIGSIEFWLNMLPLFQAMRRLENSNKVKLLLIGTKLRTKTAERVQEQIKQLRIEKNVIWLKNFVPYHEVPNYMAAMDLGTIPFNPVHPTAYYSAPNKLWEYLALEKPVITTPIPDSIVQAGQFIEIAVRSSDYERIIRSYIKAPDKFQEKAKCARSLIRKKTWHNIAERYERALESVV